MKVNSSLTYSQHEVLGDVYNAPSMVTVETPTNFGGESTLTGPTEYSFDDLNNAMFTGSEELTSAYDQYNI